MEYFNYAVVELNIKVDHIIEGDYSRVPQLWGHLHIQHIFRKDKNENEENNTSYFSYYLKCKRPIMTHWLSLSVMTVWLCCS